MLALRLLEALDNFLETQHQIVKVRALKPIRDKLEKDISEAFLNQGKEFLKLFVSLKPRIDEDARQFALKEGISSPDWEPLFNQVELSTIQTFSAPIDTAARQALLAGGSQTVAEMGLPLSFNLANPRAVTFLEFYGAEKVTKINEETKAVIRSIVVDGVSTGQSYDKMAQQISAKFTEFAVGKPQLHIDSRAHLVAVTESANAYVEGNMIVAKDLQAGGLEMEKFWSTVGDDRVSDGCDQNQSAGWQDLNDPFPATDGTYDGQQPPRFPGCRCDLLLRRKPGSAAASVLPGPSLGPIPTKVAGFNPGGVVNRTTQELYVEAKRNYELLDADNARESASSSKAKIVKDITNRVKKLPEFAGLSRKDIEEDINSMVYKWASTSADSDEMAIMMQLATAEEFGLKNVAYDHWSNALVKAVQTDINTIPGEKLLYSQMRAVARAQYEITQEFLKTWPGDTIILYRGVGIKKSELPLSLVNDRLPQIVEIISQPISSYSVNPLTAGEFAERAEATASRIGTLIAAEIPKTRIFSTAMTGFGCKREGEMVVLGAVDSVLAARSIEDSIFENVPGILDKTLKYVPKVGRTK